jgi:ferric-dicitrate binding protein FerR (iron transport regulator)
MRDDEKLRELMLRYLEGALPPAELEKLNRAVTADPAARRELAEMMLQETLLSRIGKETDVDELRGAQKRVSSFNTTTRILQIQRKQESRRTYWLAAASASVVLFTLTLLLAVKSLQSPEPRLERTVATAPESSPVPLPEPAPEPEIPRLPAPAPVVEATPDPAPVSPAPKLAPAPQAKQPAVKNPDVPAARPADPAVAPAPQPANAQPLLNPTDKAPIDPAGRYGDTSLAKIERVQGEVIVLAGAVRKTAKAGQDLLWGQGVETVGANASAVIRYADGTRVELAPRTAIWESSERPAAKGAETAKRLRVGGGTLIADVARQAANRPMILFSTHGEAKILGTSFKLSVEAESMRLEMKEGKIQVTRKDDKATADVGAGFYVVVGKGIPLDVKPIPALDGVHRDSRSK